MIDANYLQQALQLHDQWEFDAAREAYAQALRHSPSDHQALYGMGLLLGQHMLLSAKSMPYLEAAIGAKPRAFAYWRTYINMLIREGLSDMARSLIELARSQGMQQIALERLEKDLALTQGVEAAAFLEAQVAAWEAQRPPPNSDTPTPQMQIPAELLKALSRQLQQRSFKQADDLLASALHAYPRSALLWQTKINMELERGDHAAALEAAHQSTAALPRDSSLFMLLGEVHLEAKEAAQAEPALRQAVLLSPQSSKAHELLGNALLAQGQAQASYPHFVQALLLAADVESQALVQFRLISALHEGGQPQLCAQFLSMLLQQPLDSKLHLACGDWMRKLGWNLQAEMAYRQALQQQPKLFMALVGLSLSLSGDAARLAERETVLRRIVELSGDSNRMLARADLAYVLFSQERWEPALELLATILEESPGDSRAHRLRCLLLLEKMDLDALDAALREGLAHLTDDHDLLYIKALYWGRRGDVRKALTQYDAMLIKHPNSAGAHSARLLTQLHFPGASAVQIGQSCREFGELMRRLHGDPQQQHANAKDPRKVLRVGFVSADLRGHAAAKFFLPTMRELAKCREIECIAYCNNDLYDDVTKEFMELFQQWRGVQDMSTDALVHMMQEDGIDVLIDLSGHTKGHRLDVLARRPAPVQLTWIGNPGGTGLQTMDYIVLSDLFLDRPAVREQLTERILRLPLAYVFDGGIHEEPVTSLPAQRNGYLTFGSFNRLVKVNREVVQVWGAILQALPTARLVIGACEPSGPPAHLREWLQEAGICEERVQFSSRMGFDGYLRAHHDIDICLDTFPFTGGVVTNHALWMGVPTLTLVGDLLCGRQSAEVLARVGLTQDFAAADLDGLLQLARYWNANLPRLALIRQSLRPALQALEVRQAEIAAKSVVMGLREAWRRWCDRREVEDLRISYQDLGLEPPKPLGL